MLSFMLILAAAPACEAPLPAATEAHQALLTALADEKNVPPPLRLRIDDAIGRLGKVIQRRKARCVALEEVARQQAACAAGDAGPCDAVVVAPDRYATDAHLSWALAVAERGRQQLELEAPVSGGGKGTVRAPAPTILYPFTRARRVGFFNTRGQVVLAPRFQAYEGTAWEHADTAWPKTSAWARVKLNNTWRYTDGGRELTPPGQSLGPFSEGLAAAGSGGVWLYIDTDGKAAFTKTFLRADPFSEGKAVVGDRRGVRFITVKGEPAFPGTFLDAGRFSAGKAPVKTERGWHFIDEAGTVLFDDALFEGAAPFAEGRARVGLGGGYGFIDERGRVVIEGPFEHAGSFIGGAAAVTDPSGAYHVGKDGRPLYEARFTRTGPFVDGLAQAFDGAKAGVIDERGRWVLKPSFRGAVPHPRGVIFVKDERGERAIDWSGRPLPSRAR